MIFDGAVCPVPILSNTRRVKVGVFAGDLATTTPAQVIAMKSILSDGGIPADPPPDVYNQLMEKLNSFGEEEFAKIEQEITALAEGITEQAELLNERIDNLTQDLAAEVEALGSQVGTIEEQTTALSENDSKLAEEDTAIKERLAEVEKWIDDKDYGDGILITSFSHDAGSREMGSTIKSLNLNWGLNRKPVTLTLNDEALDLNARSKHVDGLSVTMDKNTWPTWKLTATDNRNKVVSSSVSSFTFLNGVYYGAAAQPEVVDTSFVRGLLANPILTSSKGRTITANAADGEYIWYCLPKRLGSCTFKVGGFEGGFALADTIEFTNDSKYTESYYIYQSEESGLGNTTVGVS